MYLKKGKWAVLISIIFLVVALLTEAAKAQTPKVDAPILSSLSGAERDRVAKLILGARQEKELNWLDAIVVPNSAIKFTEAFKKRYGLPEFKMNHQRGTTGDVTTRVQEEVKAGRVTIDVFAVAAPGLYYDLKEFGALLKYESPEYKYYDSVKKAGLTFEPGYWLSPVAYTFTPVVNSKFYPKAISSWYDILDPQLKGKCDWPNVAGTQASLYHYIALRSVLPTSFFERYAALAPLQTDSSVVANQKLVAGELWISVTLPSRAMQVGKQAGVPLKTYYPKEGVPMMGQPYAILAKAPHPNTAKLFIDFLFSEEGQNLYVSLEQMNTGREGVKVPADIQEVCPKLSEIKSIPLDLKNLDNKKLNDAREEWRRINKR